MQTEMYMRENGKMIRLMDLVDTCTLMVPNMRGTGKKINSTEKERRHGQMALSMKATM